jgi:hypothetical protein
LFCIQLYPLDNGTMAIINVSYNTNTLNLPGDAGQLALAGGGAESGGGSGGDAASADEGWHTHVSLSSSSLLRPWSSTPASGLVRCASSPALMPGALVVFLIIFILPLL